MPNQSDPTNQQIANSPQTTAVPPVDTTPPPVIPDFQSTDIPPLPGDTAAPTPTVDSSPLTVDGSAAPPDTPPIITSTPKKKFGGGKIIATILGFLILVGGIGGGVILTQQQQNIKEKASGGLRHEQKCTTPNGNNGWCWEYSDPECGTDPGHPVECTPAGWTNCKPVTEPCGEQGGGGGGEKPGYNAQCQDVKAYSTTWAPLSASDLSKLKAGNQVNFCATGVTIPNQDKIPFTAARFKINGTQRPETTAKRPGGNPNEFCDLYTIPEGVTTFNVSAEVKILKYWK